MGGYCGESGTAGIDESLACQMERKEGVRAAATEKMAVPVSGWFSICRLSNRVLTGLPLPVAAWCAKSVEAGN